MTKELEALHLIRVYLDTEGELEMSHELNIIETALKTNKKKLDIIGEILVDISKGNYADLDEAIDDIREVLG